MEISYLGVGCVKISGRGVTLLFDPYDRSAGLPAPKVAADAVLLTGSSGTSAPEGAGLVIDGPGEYEVKGAMIVGVPARLHTDEASEDATIYAVSLDGLKAVVVGDVAAGLSPEQLEELSEADALVVPVGGYGLTLEPREATEIVSKIEPKLVIPTHYADPSVKYPVPQASVEDFCKEMGSNPEPVQKLRLVAKDLPLETTLVILKRV